MNYVRWAFKYGIIFLSTRKYHYFPRLILAIKRAPVQMVFLTRANSVVLRTCSWVHALLQQPSDKYDQRALGRPDGSLWQFVD